MQKLIDVRHLKLIKTRKCSQDLNDSLINAYKQTGESQRKITRVFSIPYGTKHCSEMEMLWHCM